jgi:hypothetical protein
MVVIAGLAIKVAIKLIHLIFMIVSFTALAINAIGAIITAQVRRIFEIRFD